MAGNYGEAEESILSKLFGNKNVAEDAEGLIKPQTEGSYLNGGPVSALEPVNPSVDPYHEAAAASANDHFNDTTRIPMDTNVTSPGGEGTAQGDFADRYVPREQTVEPTRTKLKLDSEEPATLSSEQPTVPEAPRQSKEPNEADEMSRMEGEGQAGADYAAQAEKILPNGTPEQKDSMAKWLAKKAAIAAAAGGAIYAGSQMLGGSGSGNPPPKVIPARAQTPNVPTHIKSDEEMGIKPRGGDHKVTSGVKPIAPEVGAPGEDKGNVTPQVNTLDQTIPTINDVAHLRDAQQRQDNAVFTNQIGRAADLIGAGFAGHGAAPVAQDLFNSQIKEAGSITDNYEKLADKEKDDPNSAISQDFRNYVKNLTGINLPGKTSATAAIKMMPYAYQKYAQTDAHTERMKELEIKMAQQKELLAQRLQDKKDKAQVGASEKDTKRFDTMNKTLNAEIASSRSAFGSSAKQIQQAQNLKAFMSGEKDLNDLTPQQVYEIARGMDRLVTGSGGSSSISGTEHLDPDTLRKKIANMGQFLTSKAQGAGAKSMIERYGQSIDREADVARSQMLKTQHKVLGSYHDLAVKDPEKWDQIIKSNDLPDDLLAQNLNIPLAHLPHIHNAVMQKDKDSRDIPAPDDNGAPGQVIPEQQHFNSPAPQNGGPVKIRRKSTGTTKTLAPDVAAKYLNDPDFERVN